MTDEGIRQKTNNGREKSYAIDFSKQRNKEIDESDISIQRIFEQQSKNILPVLF